MKLAFVRPAILCLFGIFQIAPTLFLAQNGILTPDEAVKLALEASYDIRIAAGDAEIARLNNTRGNAGMKPTINFVANENISASAFQQKLFSGNEFLSRGALFNNANAGVQLSWTLFDGRRMNYMKSRLEQTEALGQLNLSATAQNTAASVLLAYFDIVRGKMQEKALQEVIALNQERLRISEARLAAGFAAQTDALQARIDLNQRQSDLLVQQAAITVAKRTLNRLMVRPLDTSFDVVDTISSDYAPALDALTNEVFNRNPTLAAFQKSAEIAAILIDENRALNKARVTGLSQFNATRVDNGTGLTLNNTQAGLTVGASLVVPLYTGGNNKRLVETAKVSAEQALTRVENQKSLISNELQAQLENLQTQRRVLQLEDDNIRAARESLNVSLERFRVGNTNGLEPQTAQNALEQALVRRNLVLYNIKVAELRLRLLSGDLSTN